MTKEELQKELIERIKRCDELMQDYPEGTDERTYGEGRKSGLKTALQFVEHLEEEKMTKEDQIAELAGQLGCGDIPGDYDPSKLVDNIAEQVINFGYRKADEVRKETAREILQDISKVIKFESSLDDKNKAFNLCLEVVKDVISEYGVEVEE